MILMSICSVMANIHNTRYAQNIPTIKLIKKPGAGVAIKKEEQQKNTDKPEAGQKTVKLTKKLLEKKLEREMLMALYEELENRKKEKEKAAEKAEKAERMFDLEKIGSNMVKNSQSFLEKALSHNIALSASLYLANMTIPGKPLGNYTFWDFFLLKYLRTPEQVPVVRSGFSEPSTLYNLYRLAFKAVFGY